MTDSLMILGEVEAAKRLNLSPRSLPRLRLAGDGPPYVQLSERRIGYAVDALQAWVASRQRASTSAPILAKAGAA